MSSLSIEIDEQNSRQEEFMKQEMSKLELKWQEQVRILKKSTEIELDMKTNLIEEQQRYVGYRIYHIFGNHYFTKYVCFIAELLEKKKK